MIQKKFLIFYLITKFTLACSPSMSDDSQISQSEGSESLSSSECSQEVARIKESVQRLPPNQSSFELEELVPKIEKICQVQSAEKIAFYYLTADTLQKSGRPDRAVKYIEKALENEPDLASLPETKQNEFYLTAAKVYLENGYYQEALEFTEKSASAQQIADSLQRIIDAAKDIDGSLPGPFTVFLQTARDFDEAKKMLQHAANTLGIEPSALILYTDDQKTQYWIAHGEGLSWRGAVPKMTTARETGYPRASIRSIITRSKVKL